MISPFLKKLLKSPLLLALRMRWFRSKVGYELKAKYFGALEISIPLSGDISCPIHQPDSLYSFSEIFVTEEYGRFLDDIEIPKRWLDLGCHVGYFSLYLAWRSRVSGKGDHWTCLLVDADPRVKEAVDKTLGCNGWAENYVFLNALIGPRGSAAATFALREGMGSSAEVQPGERTTVGVEILSETALLREFPPPYDLLKIDIEGGEFLFFENYREVCRQTKAIVVEWHSWDEEGTGEARLQQQLAGLGFQRQRVLQPRRVLKIDGRWLSVGTHLYLKC